MFQKQAAALHAADGFIGGQILSRRPLVENADTFALHQAECAFLGAGFGNPHPKGLKHLADIVIGVDVDMRIDQKRHGNSSVSAILA